MDMRHPGSNFCVSQPVNPQSTATSLHSLGDGMSTAVGSGQDSRDVTGSANGAIAMPAAAVQPAGHAHLRAVDTLAALLRAGYPLEDPRCQTLLQLIQAANASAMLSRAPCRAGVPSAAMLPQNGHSSFSLSPAGHSLSANANNSVIALKQPVEYCDVLQSRSSETASKPAIAVNQFEPHRRATCGRPPQPIDLNYNCSLPIRCVNEYQFTQHPQSQQSVHANHLGQPEPERRHFHRVLHGRALSYEIGQSIMRDAMARSSNMSCQDSYCFPTESACKDLVADQTGIAQQNHFQNSVADTQAPLPRQGEQGHGPQSIDEMTAVRSSASPNEMKPHNFSAAPQLPSSGRQSHTSNPRSSHVSDYSNASQTSLVGGGSMNLKPTSILSLSSQSGAEARFSSTSPAQISRAPRQGGSLVPASVFAAAAAASVAETPTSDAAETPALSSAKSSSPLSGHGSTMNGASSLQAASLSSSSGPSSRPSAPSTPSTSANPFFPAADLIFQTKAQIAAFRSVSRGIDPAPEVLVASSGKRPRSGPALELPLLPEGYVITANDVRRPGEIVSESALRQRVRRAQARQNRLRAYLKQNNDTGISAPERSTGRLDPMSPSVSLRSSPKHLACAKHGGNGVELQNRNHLVLRKSFPQFAASAGAHIMHMPIHMAPVDLRSSSQGLSLSQNCSATKTGVIPPASQSHAHVGTSSPVQAMPLKAYDELVADREMRLRRRLESRLTELANLPIKLPDDVRRRAVIESKSLNLLHLQRAVRTQVMAVMHRLLSHSQPPGFGAAALAKSMKPAPMLYATLNPQGLVNGKGGYLSVKARERIRDLEGKHHDEQALRHQKRQAKFAVAFTAHAADVRSVQHAKGLLHRKLLKDLDRHFRDKAREEDRRKRREQQDRLRALRNNDEDEYLALLQNTKNTRLLQLLRQTDEYLVQLGAKVEAQKEAARADLNAIDVAGQNRVLDAHNQEDVSPGMSDDLSTPSGPNGERAQSPDASDSIQAMRARRNQYYTISHSIKEKVKQPSSLIGGTLKPYQIDGLEWMVSLYNNGLNGILADEMGLGKTIQTISLLTYLVEVKRNNGPFLIIVPLSTMSNWVREMDTWAPSLVKVVYRGNPEMRKSVQHRQMTGKPYNVVLTTYEFVVKDKLFLGKISWKYIIIDEGHRMKNAECKLALTLGAKYRTRNRILLTGTPLQNNLTELWALLNFLLPTIFSSAETFETWFNAPFQASALGGNTDLNEEEQLLVISRLHQVLRPFMLRRLKTDVETQLPEKVESVLRCDMSVWQRVLYRQMSSKLGIASSGSVRTFNNVVMQLKKICNHPYLFYNDEELISMPKDFLVRSSGKFSMLEHALLKLKATGHRVLIFSQMTAALDYLEYFLAGLAAKHMRLDGTTKADDRQRMLEEFNAQDSEYFCFLLSTRAGGLGLNLQTADTVFIFDSDWNPMMDLQAQDRAHRIGQTKEVRVFRLITASSVEEKILERANRKLQMDAQVIQAGQFNNQSSDSDRTQMLKEILQSQAKDDEEEDDIPPLEDLNRILARNEAEFEIFQDMDCVRLANEIKSGKSRLMTDESELPPWVLQPDQHQKQTSRLEEEIDFAQHGRGRRRRSEVTYDDGLTDKEWTQAVERDEDIVEASRRKRRRVSEDLENGWVENLKHRPLDQDS